MAWISAVFFCLGAADTLLGDRLGLGSAFRQGFAAVVDLLLLMTGFMALAPWLGTHLAPVITPVFSAVGCDPSLFPLPVRSDQQGKYAVRRINRGQRTL